MTYAIIMLCNDGVVRRDFTGPDAYVNSGAVFDTIDQQPGCFAAAWYGPEGYLNSWNKGN